jgi:hypothetical protein
VVTSKKYCEETCFGCGWSRFYKLGEEEKSECCPMCDELLERFAHSEDEFERLAGIEGGSDNA